MMEKIHLRQKYNISLQKLLFNEEMMLLKKFSSEQCHIMNNDT
jgi:hypothetical protein